MWEIQDCTFATRETVISSHFPQNNWRKSSAGFTDAKGEESVVFVVVGRPF